MYVVHFSAVFVRDFVVLNASDLLKRNTRSNPTWSKSKSIHKNGYKNLIKMIRAAYRMLRHCRCCLCVSVLNIESKTRRLNGCVCMGAGCDITATFSVWSLNLYRGCINVWIRSKSIWKSGYLQCEWDQRFRDRRASHISQVLWLDEDDTLYNIKKIHFIVFRIRWENELA